MPNLINVAKTIRSLSTVLSTLTVIGAMVIAPNTSVAAGTGSGTWKQVGCNNTVSTTATPVGSNWAKLNSNQGSASGSTWTQIDANCSAMPLQAQQAQQQLPQSQPTAVVTQQALYSTTPCWTWIWAINGVCWANNSSVYTNFYTYGPNNYILMGSFVYGPGPNQYTITMLQPVFNLFSNSITLVPITTIVTQGVSFSVTLPSVGFMSMPASLNFVWTSPTVATLVTISIYNTIYPPLTGGSMVF